MIKFKKIEEVKNPTLGITKRFMGYGALEEATEEKVVEDGF